MSEDKFTQQVLAEREFLHDISTPLMVAMGNVDQVVRKHLGNDSDMALDRLNKAAEALQKISEKLTDRRAILHSLSEKK